MMQTHFRYLRVGGRKELAAGGKDYGGLRTPVLDQQVVGSVVHEPDGLVKIGCVLPWVWVNYLKSSSQITQARPKACERRSRKRGREGRIRQAAEKLSHVKIITIFVYMTSMHHSVDQSFCLKVGTQPDIY